MSDVSPTPRLGVAEAMGRNAATRAGMGPRMLVVIGTICVPRVGRGGYSVQG